MHLALGTSMATIFFTSISSLRTHHAHGAVLWPVVARITPGIILGTLIGTHVASLVPTRMLALIFTLFICYVSVQMIINLKPQAHRDLPGIFGTGLVGAGIGFISCLVAIGGGVLSVPFMTWCNVKMQNAIGTSCSHRFSDCPGRGARLHLEWLGGGWLAVGQPWFCLRAGRGGGCRSERADCADRVPVSTHQLPVKTLKRVFAGILLALAGKMMWGLFSAP